MVNATDQRKTTHMTSSVDVGTKYEQFVQEIYSAIMKSENVETITVEHNTTVAGKSGCSHQIDVYWEFKVAGEVYRTAIECKAYAKTVPIGRIRDFYGVLSDVNNLRGIFVSQHGFQIGARKFAKSHGISLKEIREPNEEDWDGRVREIHLNVHIVVPEILKFTPLVNQEFLDSLPPEGMRIGETYSTHEKIIFDAANSPVASREELRQKLPKTREPETGLHHRFSFPGHILRYAENDIPIEGIEIVYDVNVDKETIVTKGDEIVKSIVRDAISGELAVVHADGEVHTKGS